MLRSGMMVNWEMEGGEKLGKVLKCVHLNPSRALQFASLVVRRVEARPTAS